MAPPYALDVLRQRLTERRHDDEVLSPLDPRALLGGTWWQGGSWPDALSAGVLEACHGYRFRPENLALAGLIRGIGARRVVDLGAGTGSLTLIVAAMCEPERIVAVERQAGVAERLARTIDAHALASVQLQVGDVRSPVVLDAVLADAGGAADLIVTNPPFFEAGWGRESRNAETHLSTHAVHGDVQDFLSAAARLLADEGRVFVVFDAQRMHLVMAAAGQVGLGLEELRWIPDRQTGAPFRCWMMFGWRGATVGCLGGGGDAGGGR